MERDLISRNMLSSFGAEYTYPYLSLVKLVVSSAISPYPAIASVLSDENKSTIIFKFLVLKEDFVN